MGRHDNNQPMSWEELEEFLGIELQRPTEENTKIKNAQIKNENLQKSQEVENIESVEQPQDFAVFEDKKEEKTLNTAEVSSWEKEEKQPNKTKEVDNLQEEIVANDFENEPNKTRKPLHRELMRGIVWSEVLNSPLAKRKRRRKKCFARQAFRRDK